MRWGNYSTLHLTNVFAVYHTVMTLLCNETNGTLPPGCQSPGFGLLRNFGIKPNFRIYQPRKGPLNRGIYALTETFRLWHRHCLKPVRNLFIRGPGGSKNRNSQGNYPRRLRGFGIKKASYAKQLIQLEWLAIRLNAETLDASSGA